MQLTGLDWSFERTLSDKDVDLLGEMCAGK